MIDASRHLTRKPRMSDPSIDLTSRDGFDIMHTTRAMRRLKPDPIPDEMVTKILNAGIRAANGGNHQTWHFIVLKDRRIKEAVQVWYKKAYDQIIGPRYSESAPPPGSSADRYRRQHGAVEYLTDHYHEAPVWIVACMNHGGEEPHRMAGASIYPAVQNMLLAARALGLGATLTTRHMFFAEEADRALELPPGMVSYAIIPLGYPLGKFGPVKRGSLGDFVSLDRVGQPWS
jgi:nitroreductase